MSLVSHAVNVNVIRNGLVMLTDNITKCEKCGHLLQHAMFNMFNSDKVNDGHELVCINPDCPIGKKNCPNTENEE
jgi:hypothetical protein